MAFARQDIDGGARVSSGSMMDLKDDMRGEFKKFFTSGICLHYQHVAISMTYALYT